MSAPFPIEAFENGHIIVQADLSQGGRQWSEFHRFPINWLDGRERGVLVDWTEEGILDHLEASLEQGVAIEGVRTISRFDPLNPEREFAPEQTLSLSHLDLF